VSGGAVESDATETILQTILAEFPSIGPQVPQVAATVGVGETNVTIAGGAAVDFASADYVEGVFVDLLNNLMIVTTAGLYHLSADVDLVLLNGATTDLFGLRLNLGAYPGLTAANVSVPAPTPGETVGVSYSASLRLAAGAFVSWSWVQAPGGPNLYSYRGVVTIAQVAN